MGPASAHAALRQVFLVSGLAVAAVVVTMLVSGRGGTLGAGALVSLLVVSVVGVVGAAATVRRFGRAQLDELQRG